MRNAVLLVLVLWAVPSLAAAAPSTVERLAGGVFMVHDDAGNWGGPSLGMTHQRGPDYWARKTLDLSGLADDDWARVREVRLSAWFCVRDYSGHDAPPANGLDEALELVVNGHLHRIATAAGLPVWDDAKPASSLMRWHDFPIPKAELQRGPNEIVFRLAPPAGKKPDDYLYLGIDNTVPAGRSAVRFSPAEPWREDVLTVPGGQGEYMVRLFLLTGPRQVAARWLPTEGRVDDPHPLFDYAGAHGPTVRVEWDPRRLDPMEPLVVEIETAGAGPFRFVWLDAQGQPRGEPVATAGPVHRAELPAPLAAVPGGIELAKEVALKSVTLRASASYHPLPPRVDMAPPVAPPAGKLAERGPACRAEGAQVILENDNLRCVLARAEGQLKLMSLYNEPAAAEMVRRPAEAAFFLVEVSGKRYAGTRDFACTSLVAQPDGRSAVAHLACAEAGLEATLTARIGADLRWGLEVRNAGQQPVDFKVAFPHLAGLAFSDDPAGDYYFFPRSTLVADAPALIRQGYGDHQALYQIIDLFSPARGAGLAVWSADDDGRYKVLALRKHIPGRAEINLDEPTTPTADEFKWNNSLPAVPGTGLAYEYLRRTRAAGEAFAPPEAVLRAHAGDWHAGMDLYATWCRGRWQFRPYPSRLGPVLNMIAVGWGQSPLYGQEGYRTDFVRPGGDCLELMSWWEWSALGPRGVPLDEFRARLGEAKYQEWASYFVTDPATGRLMFSNNPGDYDGYNARWGGLPALRQAIEAYRGKGALVTLYTDPFRVDHNTACGREHGRTWGVVQPDGQYRDDYDAWRMCHDVAEYRQWVARTMARVLRETGADGIRLDEYGHAGSACFSREHAHTYAAPGCTEWQRGVAEATRLVRQVMDEVNPAAVLTTEHPGYDFLLPYIEGCITYDLTVLATPLRPLECNLQRFYFPECKAYELDHRGADPAHRKRFWNAVASFGSYYPPALDAIFRTHADALSGRDCRPLVPTLAPGVYANQFRAPGKTIYTLYNATGHTFHGDVLELDVPAGDRIAELVRGAQPELAPRGGRTVVRLFLAREDVACLLVGRPD